MNKEIDYLKEHLYEIYKYKKSMKDLTYDMDLEHLLRTCKALDYSQKEIERLNKELEKYKYSADELNEIERLNNIIKELEKWLEEQHQFIIEIPAYTKEISIEHKTMEICYENILDKLQELKGSD